MGNKVISSICLMSFLLTSFVMVQETLGSENNPAKETSNVKNLEERIAALEDNRWTNKVSIHGVLSGAYQYESPSSPQSAESFGRGAVAFQPEVSIMPTDQDEILFKFGFPAGNGVNGETQMVIPPWAATLEDDVKGINGRDRDYLLTAWYKHIFKLDDDHDLGITGGIIDATDYIDQNAYANDEYTQFMNPALVNGANGFAPSYDIGGALEWGTNAFYANGVMMNIGENDAGYNYNFYGAEIGYQLSAGLGKGTYRIIYEGSQDAFPDPTGTTLEDRNVVFFSCDQKFGKHIGGWVRLGWGTDDAAVDLKNLYSGGIDIRGSLWRRGADNIGIGYAFLEGGNTGLKSAQVAEAYYRMVMNDLFALTGDVQYQDNQYENTGAGNDIEAFTLGLRAVVEF